MDCLLKNKKNNNNTYQPEKRVETRFSVAMAMYAAVDCLI